ncbi:hypothetical protein [Rickettsiales endosymbiont of Stachyamoeba lipophora]|uniref:hypothetical protein n=1 Tax=Rickettsiales endosymbiont of Stachyamoeba lipophora TaxID=2486578 RepID=UPI000F649C74|nr:hypothetical protein [Rickettsiales endosymbiont of Stachyamoeba lipophora]AZL14977.1 hypothetical protein EF513_00120 [Rickettsiales endosymbiont of Stachyamoeba lipophora]
MSIFSSHDFVQEKDSKITIKLYHRIYNNIVKAILQEQPVKENKALLLFFVAQLRKLTNKEIESFLQIRWDYETQQDFCKEETFLKTSAKLIGKTFLEITNYFQVKNIAEEAIKTVREERLLPTADKYRKINEIFLDNSEYKREELLRAKHIKILLLTLSEAERIEYFKIKWKISKDGEAPNSLDKMTFPQMVKKCNDIVYFVISRDFARELGAEHPVDNVIFLQYPAVPSQAPDRQMPTTPAEPVVPSQAQKAGKRDWLKLTLITAASILGVIGCAYLLGRFMAPKQTEAAVKTLCNAMGNIPNFALKALEQAKSVSKPLWNKVSASQNSVITRG